MPEPTNSLVLEEASRHIEAARVVYEAHAELSCNQRRVIPPSQFEIEASGRRIHLIVSAPNDPRALPLIAEALKPVRSLEDVMIIAPADFQKVPAYTIPGIFSRTAHALKLSVESPFVSIARPELLKAAEVHPDLTAGGFTRANLIGGIITYAAISDSSTIKLDTLSGVQRLLKSWGQRFPLPEVLRGALELQDPSCPKQIYEDCRQCIAQCIDTMREQGINISPDNPDFIDHVVGQAALTHPGLARHNILGYAVCSVSMRSNQAIPNYLNAIVKAFGTWGTAVPLEEIHSSVMDWLVSHQPNFDNLLKDNAKISKLVTEVENQASAGNLWTILSQAREHVFIGWCRPGDMQPFRKVFSNGGN